MLLHEVAEGQRRRAAVVATAGIALLFGVAIVRLAQIQIVDRATYERMAETNAVRLVVLPAARGVIRDRNGAILVDSVPSFALALDPVAASLGTAETDTVLSRISRLIGAPLEELEERYTKQRGEVFGPVPILRNLDMRQVAVIEEHRSELRGVSIQTEPLRHYPGTLGAHVFGYLSEITDEELTEKRTEGYRPGSMVGRFGVEKQYESYLRGIDGEEYVLTNALGQRIGVLPDRPPRAPVRGPDLYLTLDLAVQRAAEEAFPESLRGGLVALDPNTGGVLALVSRPLFDPGAFAIGLTRDQWRRLLGDRSFPLLSRPLQAAYPPGSTWKPLTGLAGLENDRITPETRMVPCAGGFYYGHRWFRCWWHPGHGSQQFFGALVRSCDTYFYQVGLRVGIDPMYRWAERCGLIGKTGIDLPQERKNFVPNVEWYDKRFTRRGWGRGVVLSLGIGQAEILETPLSLAAFYSLLVNGGNRVTPHLLLKVQPAKGRARDIPKSPEPKPVAIHPATLKVIREALEGVVSDPNGTGGRARIEGVRVGGKTGTAQNPHGEDHALFVGVAPMDQPKIVVAVVVENVGHGGTYAAPIARRVMEALVKPVALAAPPDPVSGPAVSD